MTEMREKQHEISRAYARLRHRKILLLLVLVAALIVLATAAVFLGTSDIHFSGLLSYLFPGWGASHGIVPLTGTQIVIVLTLRLPRIISAVLVGAAMGICGTVMQSTTGNVMASPFTTGISSAAGLGAAIGIDRKSVV